MINLPIDERGFLVPWFVGWIDGKPDFRVVRAGGVALAYNYGVCWLCGQRRGAYHAFVVGPMCGINRVSSEPPSHLECAEYAVKACPFLTRPLAVRRERDMPEHKEVAGVMIKRNPGVSLVWVTKNFKPFKAGNGVLFKLGDPKSLQFWREGRLATRGEVDESVASGLPALEEAAKLDGPDGVNELYIQKKRFTALLDKTMGRAG